MEGINVSRKLAKQAELETEADELGLTSKQRADRLRQHKYVGGPSIEVVARTVLLVLNLCTAALVACALRTLACACQLRLS